MKNLNLISHCSFFSYNIIFIQMMNLKWNVELIRIRNETKRNETRIMKG